MNGKSIFRKLDKNWESIHSIYASKQMFFISLAMGGIIWLYGISNSIESFISQLWSYTSPLFWIVTTFTFFLANRVIFIFCPKMIKKYGTKEAFLERYKQGDDDFRNYSEKERANEYDMKLLWDDCNNNKFTFIKSSMYYIHNFSIGLLAILLVISFAKAILFIWGISTNM